MLPSDRALRDLGHAAFWAFVVLISAQVNTLIIAAATTMLAAAHLTTIRVVEELPTGSRESAPVPSPRPTTLPDQRSAYGDGHAGRYERRTRSSPHPILRFTRRLLMALPTRQLRRRGY